MKPIKISLSMSTVYLLQIPGGYLQIDTGYDRDYPAYRKALGKLGISFEDIKYLFLTHHHDDHAGFLNDLTRDASVTIIAHELAKDLLVTGKNDKTRGGGYINAFVKFIVDVKMRLDPNWTLTFQPFHIRPDDILLLQDDNTLLRDLGLEGDIIYTPGHCVDHIALVTDSGEVFCGDAAASFPLFAGTKYCAVFMTDMEDTYRSWKKILDAGGKLIFPAHGRPFPASKLAENMGKIKTQDLVRFF